MSKYTKQFKLALVEQYLAGANGYQSIRKQHGGPHSMFRKWVGLFRKHGTDGLGKKFSQAVRANLRRTFDACAA